MGRVVAPRPTTPQSFELVEATHAHVTQRAAFEHDSLLPFSQTFGLNSTFCQCIVASSTV